MSTGHDQAVHIPWDIIHELPSVTIPTIVHNLYHRTENHKYFYLWR